MRFDTPIFFQTIQTGEYNASTGDYGEDIVTEVKKYASVSGADIETVRLLYGELKQGACIVRLQRPYTEPFSYIRIGSKIYSVDHEKPLNNKTVFIVSEVQRGEN